MKIISKWRTLAFRLTVLYVFMFFISSTVVFGVSRILVSLYLIEQADNTLFTYWSQLSLEIEMDIVPSVELELAEKAMARGKERVFYQVLDSSGLRVASSDLTGWSQVTIDPFAVNRALKGNKVFTTFKIPDLRRRLRIMYAPFKGGGVFVAGVSLVEQDNLLRRLTEIFVSMVFLTLIIGMPLGWQMARRAMSGVEEVAKVASDIAKGEFDRRVSVTARGEEIDRLAASFNAMLEHIQGFMRQMREINDNIAHDLRTPVTRIRGMAETTLIINRSVDDYREMASDIIEECDRLLGIINTILEIAETETGLANYRKKEIDLARWATEGVALFRTLAEEKGINLEIEAQPDCCNIWGDEIKLQRLLANLLDNAIKFTSVGGRIKVSVFNDDLTCGVTVEDTGIGISEDDLPDIFNRFFMADRSRTTAGYGLGLSLAKSIAKAHDGDITVVSQPGQGSIFTVTIPRGSPSPRANITIM